MNIPLLLGTMDNLSLANEGAYRPPWISVYTIKHTKSYQGGALFTSSGIPVKYMTFF